MSYGNAGEPPCGGAEAYIENNGWTDDRVNPYLDYWDEGFDYE